MKDLTTPDTVNTPSTSTIAQLMITRQRQGDAVQFEVSEDWGQGRTLFGGLLSALAVGAMRDVHGSDWPLRALQTSFVSPLEPGAMQVRVELLRQGKNVRQVKAQLIQIQQGQAMVAAVFLGVFGSARASSLPGLAPAMPESRSADKCMALPFLPGLTPNFTQHLDFRMAEGGFPFTGTETWSSKNHVKLKAPEGFDAELCAILLADAGPTPALHRLKAPAAASSVSWALELIPMEPQDPQGFWRMDKDVQAFGAGYVNETTRLWSPSGQLAALGYQVVAVYA